jgi:hypothetical protein
MVLELQDGELIHLAHGCSIWVSPRSCNVSMIYSNRSFGEVFLYIETVLDGGMHYLKVLTKKGIGYVFAMHARKISPRI